MRLLVIAGLATLLVGCKRGGATVTKPADTPALVQARLVALKFGNAVRDGDWNAAASLIAPTYRSKFTASSMKNEYEGLISQIKFRDPEFKVNGVEVDEGDLPATVDDARGPYHIDPVPDKKSWIGWMSASIGMKDGDFVGQGVDAWMLLIDDGGTPRIGHVNFEFLD